MKPNKSIEIEQKLDSVLESIRQTVVPDFPKAEIALKAKQSSHDVPTASRRWFSIPLLATCAGLLLAISIVIWPDSKQTAFAQVQEALNKLKTLQYTVYDVHGTERTYITKVIIQEPGKTRVESKHGGTIISNNSTKENLRIDHKTKTATFFEVNESQQARRAQTDLLAFYRNIPAHATERIGDGAFEGKPVERFLAGAGDRKFLVTVDSRTMLPIKMEYTRGDFKETFTDFIFDAPLDPSLFAPRIPEGYQVKRQTIGAPHPLADTLVVSPTSGLNHLDFGCSIEEVIEFLGEPNLRDDDEMVSPFDSTTIRSTTLYYRNAGLSLFFNSEGLASMNCEGHSQVIDFAGETDHGIRLGDPVEKVLKAYGKPELRGEDHLEYIRKGLMFLVYRGKVGSIQIKEPVHPSLKIILNDDGEGYMISAGQAPVVD